MIKTRMIKGQTAFYETTTGVTLKDIRSVGFLSYTDIIVTVIYKDSVPYIYLPFRDGNPLVSLQTAIERMELNVLKVS